MYRGLALVLSLLVGACAISVGHAGPLRTVALSGDSAPGTPAGVTFRRPSVPQLNSSGHVSFVAGLEGESVTDVNDEGIWSESGGALHLVTRAGELHSLPGVPNPIPLVRFEDHWLNDAGVTLLRGSSSASVLTKAYSYWTSDAAGLEYFIHWPGTAPGTSTGVTFDSFQGFAFNAAGQIAFRATLAGTGVSSANDTGFWFFDGTAFSLLAREGDLAPGSSSRRFAESLGYVVLNDAGQFAFVASTRNNTGGSPTASLWSNRSGQLEALAGTNGGSINSPQINDHGHVAYVEQNSTNTSDRLRAEYWYGFGTVAESGQLAPGTSGGERFDDITWIALNNADQVAFMGSLNGPSVAAWNDEGIWVQREDGLSLVARTGDQAALPGFSSLPVYINGLSGLTHNARGQVAFLGELSYRQQEAANAGDGLFVFDVDGRLKTIAQTGMEIDVDDGPGVDLRTINSLAFLSAATGNGDGRPTAFNDRGQITYWAFFTDGSYGIFLSNAVAVPEPSALAIATIGIGLLVVTRGHAGCRWGS